MIHVSYRKKDKAWFIVDDDPKDGENSVTLSGPHSPKSVAITLGRRAARDRKTELCIKLRNGRIQRKHSYGNDSRMVKG